MASATAVSLPRVEPEGPGALDVFVLVAFPAPIDAGWLQLTGLPVRNALESRGVHCQESFLATDARRLLCRLRAPDAPTVACALAEAGITPAALWAGLVRELCGHLEANVIAERTLAASAALPTPPRDELRTVCLVTHRVTPTRIALSLDGRHLLAFYHAPDAESVRLAQRHASPDRIWAFRPTRTPG